MSCSPRNRIDVANGLARMAGILAVLAIVAVLHDCRIRPLPAAGEVQVFPELHLRLAPVPTPEIPVPPEPEEPPPPEILPAPAPEPEPEPEPVPELEIESEPSPQPDREPEEDSVPLEAAQLVVAEEGDSGMEEAVRNEWLVELRRRIEQSKFYPGGARSSRVMGTVTLRVEIGADGTIGSAEVVKNTGSALLAEGARAILKRAAAKPLGTNALPHGFQVEVPITYRLEER